MMALTKVMQEDRRLVILRTLSEVPSYTLNEDILRQALQAVGHPEAARDFVRADLDFLREHGLVRWDEADMPSGKLRIVGLTGGGLEVAQGRPHEGVARLKPTD
jgi:hypothetical protein